MVPIKTIDKLKRMYFDEGFAVREISRKTHYSPCTIYKYIRMCALPIKPDTSMPAYPAIKQLNVFEHRKIGFIPCFEMHHA